MRQFYIATLIGGCFLTSSIAFADVISLGQGGAEPVLMLVLGIGLLGLAGIGKKRA